MFKKTFLLIVGIIFAVAGITHGEDILDYVNSLSSEFQRGYSAEQQINVANVSETSVTIESPIITDDFNKNVSYIMRYSQYTLEELLENNDLLNSTKHKTFDSIVPVNGKIAMELNDPGIDGDAIYYAFVIPQDIDLLMGVHSNEVCFVLSQLISGNDNECIALYNKPVHAAAGGADAALMNVSHTIDDKHITVTWIAIDGSNDIDLYLMEADDTDRTLLTTINMLDLTYEFDATHYGSHTLKFAPSNGGQEKTYTLNVVAPDTKDPGKKIPVVPKTGPTQTAMLILIIAIVAYILYRRFAKREN